MDDILSKNIRTCPNIKKRLSSKLCLLYDNNILLLYAFKCFKQNFEWVNIDGMNPSIRDYNRS